MSVSDLVLTASDEIQVNTFTLGYQGKPSIAGLPNGGFVVAWEGQGIDFEDDPDNIYDGPTTNKGIFIQNFASNGAKNGNNLMLDYDYPYSFYGPADPSVTTLADGNSIVSYTVYNTHSLEYAPSPTIGGEMGLNPSVSGFSGGGYIVVWDDVVYVDDPDAVVYGMAYHGRAVSGQLYSPDGAKLGDKFVIKEGGTYSPLVCVLSDDSFVVIGDGLGQDGSGAGVFGQHYTSDGIKVGNEFLVNTYASGHQSAPSITSLSDGEFVVTWESEGQDGSGHGVYGQRFDANATKVGDEFLINTYTINDQKAPSVTALVNGEFVVTWESEGQDGSGHGVYGQRFTVDGVKIGDEFLINTYTQNSQFNSVVTALEDGGFAVAWESQGQDGSGSAVIAKMFNPFPSGLDDVFIATLPVETFDGKGGNDTVDYRNSTGAVNVDLLNNKGTGGFAQGDGFISIENITGSDSNSLRDWIWGDGNVNILKGLAGDDILEGGVGADIIDGGAGWDYARYTRSVTSVNINLATSTFTGGDAQDDSLFNIEAIFGSEHDDTLIGDGSNNYLSGGGGADFLSGNVGWDKLLGNDGDDILNGGDGTDWLKGGAGKDLFILDNLNGVDTIADFRPNEKIDLTVLLDGAIGFLTTQAFAHGFLSLQQNGADTHLHIDLDGNAGTNPEQLLAILLGVQASALGFANFILPEIVNTAPVAKDDGFTGNQGAIIMGNVLSDNGFGADSDADGDPLTIVSGTYATAHGSITIARFGTFSYTPNAGFHGTDSFEYTLDDGRGGTDIGLVNFTVSPLAPPPPALPTPISKTGTDAHETLIGGHANDTLKGGGGDDVLIGNSGWDRLEGNEGNDILYGGRGADKMKGGAGADLFVLDGVTDRVDTIEDLRLDKGDRIQIKDILSFDPLHEAISDFVQIVQNGVNSLVSVDADGSQNGAHFTAVAQIAGVTGLDMNQLYADGDLVISHIVV